MTTKKKASQEPEVKPAAEAQNIQNEGAKPAEPTATEPGETPAPPQGEPPVEPPVEQLKADADAAKLALEKELAEKAQIEAEAARVALEAEEKLENELAYEAIKIMDSDERFNEVDSDEYQVLESELADNPFAKEKLRTMTKEERAEYIREQVDRMWEAIKAKRCPVDLAPYWEAYPEAAHLYVTTDGMVFLQANHNDAVNHARTLGTPLKSFTRK